MQTEAEKRKIKWLIGSLAVIALLVNSYFYKPGSFDAVGDQGNYQDQNNERGTTKINDHEWHGKVLTPGKRIEAWILTPGVWWQARLDNDDNKIYTLHPASYNTNDSFVFPKQFNVIDWRIKPGQSKKEGSVAWSISPSP